MKVSLNWLNEYVDLKHVAIAELEKAISLKVCEIESSGYLVNATNLTIGLVIDVDAHPDSDHLNICQIMLKDNEISQIVCGASNIAIGQRVIVALPGAELPGGFKIKSTKIRGVESNGMVCSLKELGLEDKYIPEEFRDGIYVLDVKAPLGENPLKYMGLDDYVIELGLTPNRADLLSIIGVAYDVATCFKKKVALKKPYLEEISDQNPMEVQLETDEVYQYHMRYIKNVKIAESPWWIKSKLIAAGIRPINNVVDITNYILLEYGQPLHAFDADKIGTNVVVRHAKQGETIVTLDGIERKLVETDLLITDGKNPICLAGVMGGLDSEVTQTTCNIALEAAQFDPIAIRKTGSRLNLRSESSQRFERKIDSNRVVEALEHATQLLCEVAGGAVAIGIASQVNRTFTPIVIETSIARMNQVLGISLAESELECLLSCMKFTFEKKEKQYFVTIPSRRMDYEANEQDLMEDIARFYGFEYIPLTLPKTANVGSLSPIQKITREIKQLLIGLGVNEAVTYSLQRALEVHDFVLTPQEPYHLLMPLTEDRSTFRQSILPNLLKVVSYHAARQQDDLQLFELSKVYGQTTERLLLSGAFTGMTSSSLWQGKKEFVDFYYVKGILDVIFDRLGLGVEYVPIEIHLMHPGRTAFVKHGKEVLGFIGEVNPIYQHKQDLPQTYVFELDFARCFELCDLKVQYVPVSKFPSISRDLALVIKKETPIGDALALIRQTARKILIDLEVFDIFEGPGVAEGYRSVAVKLTFNDHEKTLETNDVNKAVQSILNRLEHELQITLRS